jgi:hypothetical protein
MDLQQPPQSILTICSPAFLDPDDDEDAATLRVAVQLVVRSLFAVLLPAGALEKGLDIEEQSMVSCFIETGIPMESKAGPFTFAELLTVTSLGRGEIRECVNRGIISASAGVGQGNHRAYSKWNLVEGAIAAALLRHLRAGSVAHGMMKLRSMLEHSHIDPEDYCKAPGTFYFSDFKLIFPPRSEPDDKAGLPLGEDLGEGAYLLGTASATRVPYYGPPLTRGLPIAAFCKLSIDLEQAVRFVNYMIETRL